MTNHDKAQIILLWSVLGNAVWCSLLTEIFAERMVLISSAKGLTEDDPRLARRIERQAKRKAASSEHRKKYARTVAGRAGYKTKDWDNELLLRAGEWALLALLQKLPDVFTVEDGPREDDNKGTDKFLTITDAARSYADHMVAQVILRNPVWQPRPEAPKPWIGWNDGGVWGKRLARSLSLMRSRQKHTKEAVEQAIRDGTMKPALDGLNSLQAVPSGRSTSAFSTRSANAPRAG